ncbi:MAG: DNRLRE domain-containing protein [Chloroflexi bacterium]|nr:DNRLRE domain-containing protein [Chloroflexota bacterium]
MRIYFGSTGNAAATGASGILTVDEKQTTSLSVSPATGTYGGDSTLTATLTNSAGSPVSGKSIAFTVNGSSVGSASTDASGTASLAGVSLAGINAGAYPTAIGASYAGDTAYITTSASGSLNVNKADPTCTVTGFTGNFDGTSHGASGSCTGVGSATLTGLDLGASYADVPGGTANWTFTDVSGNYNNASGSVNIVINKVAATCSITGFTGDFDGAAHGASGSCTGVGGATLTGLDLGSSFTDAPGGVANWSFTNTNYNDESGTANIVINKIAASCSVSGFTGDFDSAAHGASGSCTGLGGATLTGLDLGSSFTDAPGGTANWSFTNANYNDASGTANIVINKVAATCSITGFTGDFDGAAHGASGSCTGLGGATLTGLDLGSSFTDAPGGTANWMFTDTTGNYNNASGSVDIVIGKKTLTVTADSKTKRYTAADPVFTYTATGFVAPDTFSTAPTCSVPAPHGSAGVYDIICSGGIASGNYVIAYFKGTLTVTAVNNTPTNIALSSASVNENQPVGATVGVLSTTDPDAGDIHIYSFCGGANDASFKLSGANLQTNVVFDFESKNSYSVCVRTNDGHGGTFNKTFTIAIGNLTETLSFVSKSTGAQDGWILEKGENTNTGGVMNSNQTSLRIGDDIKRKQYRSVLSFSTGALPDNAIITKVTLRFKKQTIAGGGNPITAFQGFMLDIRKGSFGTIALQALDWKTNPNKTVGPFKPALKTGWYSINLTSYKAYVNKLNTGGGLTQIRLRFKLDDNNNSVPNYLAIYSGNAGTNLRPQLIVEYRVP